MKNGFTLAEVLITLVIIGVIAALTVPSLIQRTNKQEYVTAIKKAYSTLSQASQQIIAEEGNPNCDKGGWACSNKDVIDAYKKHLNVLKDCGTDTACFGSSAVKTGLNGIYKIDLNSSDGALINNEKLILSDGTHVAVWQTDTNCAKRGAGTNEGSVCSKILVDINGSKGPNIVGRDVVGFMLMENGLYPEGCDSDYCIPSNSGEQGHGWGCLCRVIRENAMNY